MARKQMIEGGTKNRIREVGGRQIFEHGYDGTSVRGIMLEVGGEVGLFYYYYKTKDDLFTDVLDHFFEPYRKDLEALAAEAKEKPYRALLRFFSYIKRRCAPSARSTRAICTAWSAGPFASRRSRSSSRISRTSSARS